MTANFCVVATVLAAIAAFATSESLADHSRLEEQTFLHLLKVGKCVTQATRTCCLIEETICCRYNVQREAAICLDRDIFENRYCLHHTKCELATEPARTKYDLHDDDVDDVELCRDDDTIAPNTPYYADALQCLGSGQVCDLDFPLCCKHSHCALDSSLRATCVLQNSTDTSTYVQNAQPATKAAPTYTSPRPYSRTESPDTTTEQTTTAPSSRRSGPGEHTYAANASPATSTSHQPSGQPGYTSHTTTSPSATTSSRETEPSQSTYTGLRTPSTTSSYHASKPTHPPPTTAEPGYTTLHDDGTHLAQNGTSNIAATTATSFGTSVGSRPAAYASSPVTSTAGSRSGLEPSGAAYTTPLATATTQPSHFPSSTEVYATGNGNLSTTTTQAASETNPTSSPYSTRDTRGTSTSTAGEYASSSSQHTGVGHTTPVSTSTDSYPQSAKMTDTTTSAASSTTEEPNSSQTNPSYPETSTSTQGSQQGESPEITTKATVTSTTQATTTEPPREVRIRKEIMDLTVDEWKAYHDAVTVLNTQIADGHLTKYDVFTKTHATEELQAHAGQYFLPYHRQLLFEFETALREINPEVTVPYWDWSIDHDKWSKSPALERLGGAKGGPLHGKYFRGWKTGFGLDERRYIFRNRVQGRPVGHRLFETRANYDELIRMTWLSFPRFSWYVEGTHGGPHVALGGEMSNGQKSPADPAFWSHHAFVDKIWSDWMREGAGSKFSGHHNGSPVSRLMRPSKAYHRTVDEIIALENMVRYKEASRRPPIAAFRNSLTVRSSVSANQWSTNSRHSYRERRNKQVRYHSLKLQSFIRSIGTTPSKSEQCSNDDKFDLNPIKYSPEELKNLATNCAERKLNLKELYWQFIRTTLEEGRYIQESARKFSGLKWDVLQLVRWDHLILKSLTERLCPLDLVYPALEHHDVDDLDYDQLAKKQLDGIPPELVESEGDNVSEIECD